MPEYSEHYFVLTIVDSSDEFYISTRHAKPIKIKPGIYIFWPNENF